MSPVAPKGIVATVADVSSNYESIVELKLTLDRDYDFRGGQWTTFRLGESLNRAYSFASPPQEKRQLRFAIRVGEGKSSAALKALRDGDNITITPAQGEFVAPHSTTPLILIGSDAGMAAVRSIALDATNRRRAIHVLQDSAALPIFGKELQSVAHVRYDRIAVDELREAAASFDSDATVMVVGFDEFLVAAELELARARWPKKQLLSETFGPKP